MSTFSLSGAVNVAAKWSDGTATIAETNQSQLALGSGSGAGQADSYWSDVVTVDTNASETIDLTSLAVSALGATGTLYLASVKHIGIVNQSANVALTVEPGATNGWSQLGTAAIGKSGVLILHSPAAGLPVTGTSKVIKLTNTHTATTLTGNTTSANAAVTGLSSTSALAAGMLVSGTGIPTGAKIASVTSGTAVTLSANATATGTGVSLTFQWPAATVKVYVAGVLD